MERLSLTSFGRQPVSAGLIARLADERYGTETVSKWDVLRDITTARKALGLSDRALTVLNALLSFHKGTDLLPGRPQIVFPSNRTLSDRAHGMAESTLRRHVASLVDAGLIRRHDSPNGKRYPRRGSGGVIVTAFGFDLSPLAERATDLSETASDIRRQETELRLARERCVLKLRDATKLIAVDTDTDPALIDALDNCRRHLRHKPSADGLASLETRLDALLYDIGNALEIVTDADKTSASDSQSERHQQRSEPKDLESDFSGVVEQDEITTTLTLATVLAACPEFLLYCTSDPKEWHGFIRNAEKISQMMGIDAHVWRDSCDHMGPCVTAITVACLLERMAEITSPGAYLRTLTRKACEGQFRLESMVTALLTPRALAA